MRRAYLGNRRRFEASIGPLYARCSNCGQPPAVGTRLIHVHRAGDLCTTCQRDHLRARPRHT